MCLHGCGILVHVVDGVAVKIDPDPDNVDNLGALCPRGNAALTKHYDRNRITKPLLRTNSEKHWDADPKWKEIPMEQALSIVSEKLKVIYRNDPRSLLCSFGDFQRYWTLAWPAGAFGALNFFSTLGSTCGGGYHPVNGAFHGTFAAIPDYNHCNYLLQLGSGDGFEGHLHLSGTARRVADARMRGMRLVVVEPRLGTAAAKADEWVPIRIGTDSALVMSLMYVMVQELGQFDTNFLREDTNAPYLVGPDGYFVKDHNGKAQVWDLVSKSLRAYDDPDLKDSALSGDYTVSGVQCQSAFQLFKDKLQEFTPEKASKITTIPTETIRRIASELVNAAEIGKTIELEGQVYSLRPAAVQWYRGAHPGNNSFMDNFAYKMINTLLGNIDMPGGHLGVPLGWNPIDWKGDCCVNKIEVGESGIIKPWLGELQIPIQYKRPSEKDQPSDRIFLGSEPGELTPELVLQHEKFGLPKPRALFAFSSNPLMNMPRTSESLNALQTMDLIATVDTQAASETTVFSDVLFPDRTFLESWSLYICEAPFVTGHTLRQPVVKPSPHTMDGTDVITELSERIGILDKWNHTLNEFLGLWKSPKYLLEKDKKYTCEEIIRRFAAAFYGENRNLEWFKKNGTSMRLKTPGELYFPYRGLRLPFYMDFVKKEGDDRRASDGKSETCFLQPWDMADYQPLPDLKHTDIQGEDLREYDLIARTTFGTYYKDLSDSSLVAEVAGNKPEISSVWINSGTATKKGIRTGDRIRITSKYDSVDGIAWLTEGLHPEAVMVSLVGRPRFRGKHEGASPTSFNDLLAPEMRAASGSYETAVRVKVEAVR
jgi:anaerobic selenocysteine-containing dehydrogenase